jgi:heme-binding uptake protein ChaN (Tiki superfamily)
MEKKDPPGTEAKKPEGRDHGSAHGVEAQSLWDATMAWSIAEQLKRQPGALVVHVNGGFHSEERLGIPEHLVRYRPGTTFLVVTMVSEKSFPGFDKAELAGRGDFVIVTDPSLPRSIPPASAEKK